MDELPTEVLSRIVKVVCPSTVRSLGTVNRRLHGIVKKTRFRWECRLQMAFDMSAKKGHENLFFYYHDCASHIETRSYTITGQNREAETLKFASLQMNLDVEDAFMFTAETGHSKIMVYLKEWGATNFDTALETASANGQLEAMCLLKEWGANPYHFKDMMIAAAARGQVNAMRLLKKWDAGKSGDDFDYAFCEASSCGQLDATRLLKEWGVTQFDKALCEAAAHGKLEAMRLAGEWGGDDFNEALCWASQSDEVDAMRLLKEWGASDFHTAYGYTNEGEAGKLLRQWIDEKEE